jgi:non-ribosomal peptide synthase protein (TIGR01720 family)
LGRYLPDGNIEFLGREDFQVKVRGYRIELGEIEAVLHKHPAVKTCIVSAVSNEINHNQLVAHVVPEREEENNSFGIVRDQDEFLVELRAWVESKLPSYMVPQNFLLIDNIPLTPTGKVDRKALLSSDNFGSSKFDSTSLDESDPIVADLVEVVTDTLGLKQVGLDQNFFEMGGDSIVAIQIISRVNALGIELTPQDIFAHQTIAELAKVVKRTQAKDNSVQTGYIPLTPFQYRLTKNSSVTLPQLCHRLTLELPEGINQHLAEQALHYLIQHHDALRLRYAYEDSCWVQMIVDDVASVYIPFIDLSSLAEDEQEMAVEQMIAEMKSEISLPKSVLTKMAIFKLNENRSKLSWLAHYLITDELSFEALLRDFSKVYNQLSCAEKPWLLPRTTSFKQWAERINQYIDSEIAQQDFAIWTGIDLSSISQLPVNQTKYPDRDSTGNSIQQIAKSLSLDETVTLLEEVKRAYRISLTETALAALANVLSTWTKERVHLIDLECDTRTHFDNTRLTQTIGCCKSVFPMLLDIQEVEGHSNLLKTTKEKFQAIIPYGIAYDSPSNTNPISIPPSQVILRDLGTHKWNLEESPSPFVLKSLFPEAENNSVSNYLLDIKICIASDQLQTFWAYRRDIFEQRQIELLADDFLSELRQITTHCQLPESREYCPQDFPNADLAEEELNAVLKALDSE